MTIGSPAKINWFLYVLGKRDDGFHDILSTVQRVSLFDEIELNPSKNISLNSSSNIPDNIILKVIERLTKERGYKGDGIDISLRKNIPLSAGLGGGSSNAAEMIRALNNEWKLGLSNDELLRIAAELGSDIPFFVSERFCVMKGRGERIEYIDKSVSYDILLVNPGVPVSAGWAYRNNLDYIEIEERAVLDKFDKAYRKRDFERLREVMINSLEGPVFRRYPVVEGIKGQMLDTGARIALMSGSGSTVFGVFESKEDAERARGKFKGYWTSVVSTI
ncbi:MAG: 4-(cytidine 5'-diphospho)-2-C-methyl-D-erythritol kinase [Nitrospirota bacterium]|nr:MAG: 4-(cytidine 5'-diphospho)-2-C-methyl-D-erythritol kinase [Nitrospirota bacterium]